MSTTDQSRSELLALSNISKSFFGVRVLKDVTFSVSAGSITGLVGENGAGKSTLMNILGGNLEGDAGEIQLDGKPFAPANPKQAEQAGIAFIHQELNLFPNLSIAENLFLTRLPRAGATPFVNGAAIAERAARLLDEVGLAARPDRLVESLSAGERQLVEIAKALSIEARLIIFDEPTTSLSSRESERLFALISRLRARGVAMIYISHTLEHVLRLCDQIVVLRDGQVVGAGAASTFDSEKLVSLMVGRPITQLFPERKGRPGDVSVLEVRGVSQPGVVKNVSFSVRRGEILGLAGLMGAGRSELARILFGLDPRAAGEVRLNGESLHGLAPRAHISSGMSFLTENRRLEGLCVDASVTENLALVTLPKHSHAPFHWLSFRSLNAAIAHARELVRLDPKARSTQPVRTLSGGNQQKVVLGKWLLSEPRVFLLDEPTRGIDVGAKFEIYRLIVDLADRGAALLIISSETEELMGLCDRILVMRRGEVVDELARREFDRERILRAALGAST